MNFKVSLSIACNEPVDYGLVFFRAGLIRRDRHRADVDERTDHFLVVLAEPLLEMGRRQELELHLFLPTKEVAVVLNLHSISFSTTSLAYRYLAIHRRRSLKVASVGMCFLNRSDDVTACSIQQYRRVPLDLLQRYRILIDVSEHQAQSRDELLEVQLSRGE